MTDRILSVDGRGPALGRRVTIFEGFDTFAKPAGVDQVSMTSDALTAVCPVTGQPDQYKIEVWYAPVDVCLESKSFKLYLQSYRNDGLFCEALAAKVADDVATALACPVMVTIYQQPRGNVAIEVVARSDGGKEPDDA